MVLNSERIWQSVYTIGAICCLFLIFEECDGGPRLLMSLERPQVLYCDTNYYNNLTLKASRMQRRDPTYYVTLNITTLYILDTNTLFNFYFYELLSNIYKRTFVEFHMNACYLFEEDQVIGAVFRDALNRFSKRTVRCPIPPGYYSLNEMSWSSMSVSNSILEHFPFQEGRLYINVTYKQKSIVSVTIDFKLKSMIPIK